MDATIDPWNAACARLEAYLRTYELADRERTLRLTLEILEKARLEHAAKPGQTPVEVTLGIAMNWTDAWFIGLTGVTPGRHNPVGARGRAMWLAIGGPQRWSSVFLEENPPAELIAAIRRESLEAGPGLEFTSLLRREVDYGAVEDIARETWEKFSWSHVLRAFVLWAAIFFAAWAWWLHTHPGIAP